MLTKVTGTTQVLSVSSSVANSSVITDAVKIRLAATTDTYVEINETQTAATTSSMIIPAGTAEHFKVPATSSNCYVSCLRVTTDGKLSITIVA